MTCRFPGCDHPAEFAHIDHTIPYPLGLTHASNLKCLCRKQHQTITFELAETWLVETYSSIPGGKITHRTAPRDV